MPDDDVAAQIPTHRAYLLRVAMLQLRNSEAAEDVVQDTLIEPAFAQLDDESRIEDFDAMFDASGHWENPPADWGNPESDLSRQQFFDVMQFCLEKLPPNTARVFMMREVMELDGDEICKELTITSTNLWVILYRARMALRQCLEQHWFAGSARGAGVVDGA